MNCNFLGEIVGAHYLALLLELLGRSLVGASQRLLNYWVLALCSLMLEDLGLLVEILEIEHSLGILDI